MLRRSVLGGRARGVIALSAGAVAIAGAFPAEVAIALDEAVGQLSRGDGTAQGIVDAMNTAGGPA